MVVGEDKASLVDNHPGAERGFHALSLRHITTTNKALKNGVVS
jgi:hypothetical protein